ncbi:MAG TPA: GTP cyclohydrolase I FolE [Nitrospiria bacterium]|nr:GTP cyclohydrolase I FolE [Nitrospiria bacterium]
MSRTEISSEIEELVGRLLSLLGEDISRDGLRETPKRVEQALRFLTKGYRQEMGEVLNGAIFAVESSEMVIVRDIDFFSLCEHHMLPFFGKCHVAYLPNGRVIGLSKIPRLVELFSRRFQVQERLTMDIALAVEEGVGASGVGVVMEAQHLCMMMRGVEKQNALAVTSAMLGTFKSDPKTRMEFLDLIRRPRS